MEGKYGCEGTISFLYYVYKYTIMPSPDSLPVSSHSMMVVSVGRIMLKNERRGSGNGMWRRPTNNGTVMKIMAAAANQQPKAVINKRGLAG